jgi:hypothetical protein
MKKVLKKVTQVITGAGAAATLLAGRALAVTASPETTNGTINNSSLETIGGSSNPAADGAAAAKVPGMPETLFGDTGIITEVVRTLLYAVGIISVVMLIYGGLRYVVSGGDNKKVTDAKNTIMYAIIGLIIALLSYAIVEFVMRQIGGEDSASFSPAQ